VNGVASLYVGIYSDTELRRQLEEVEEMYRVRILGEGTSLTCQLPEDQLYWRKECTQEVPKASKAPKAFPAVKQHHWNIDKGSKKLCFDVVRGALWVAEKASSRQMESSTC
jgi:hypothetical protein